MAPPASVPPNEAKISMDELNDMMKIIVGKEKVEFTFQTSLLCHHSPYFQAASNSRWESGRQRVVELDEEEPIIFSIFLVWIVKGDFNNSKDFVQIEGEGEIQKKSYKVRNGQLLRCFILGEFLQAWDFCNAAMDLLVINHKFPAAANYDSVVSEMSIAAFIYQNTPCNSPLRHFAVDFKIKRCWDQVAPDFFDSLFTEHPDEARSLLEYFFDIGETASSIARVQGKAMSPWKIVLENPCEYHQHPGMPADYTCRLLDKASADYTCKLLDRVSM